MRVETERANLVFIAFLAVRCFDVGFLFWMPLRFLTFRMICCVLAGFLVAAVVKETPRGQRLLKKAQAIADMKQAKALGLILVVAQCVAVAAAVAVAVAVVVDVAVALSIAVTRLAERHQSTVPSSLHARPMTPPAHFTKLIRTGGARGRRCATSGGNGSH